MQEVGTRDYAMMARGVDRKGHFIYFAPPRAAFDAESLSLNDEIRTTQAAVTMKDTKNATGLDA